MTINDARDSGLVATAMWGEEGLNLQLTRVLDERIPCGMRAILVEILKIFYRNYELKLGKKIILLCHQISSRFAFIYMYIVLF